MTSPADAVFDLAVVGAGPAGLAAAAAAAECGASVVLIDAAAAPGGQYWRTGPAVPARTAAKLQHGRSALARLQHRVGVTGAVPLPRHHVQTISRGEDAWLLRCAVAADPRTADAGRTVRARRMILATGGYDRQLPFPGWDLPGVMTAGGAQALLKGAGVVPGRSVVVAGTGPFLLPVAAGLVALGARVPLVAEANSPARFARHPRALAGAPSKLAEAASYATRFAAGRVRYRTRHAVVRALGRDRVEAVEVARLDRGGMPIAGSGRVVPCDVLAVGWGFTPQLDLHLQVGCDVSMAGDGSLIVEVDDRQRTSVDEVWAAGESTGIGGADLARVEGEIAGRTAAGSPASAALGRRRAALRRFAEAMHAVHPVPRFLLETLPDDVLVCRCEEVTAGTVRGAITTWGATDARSVKLFTRTGMGWCQGRVCGFGTAGLTALSCRRDVEASDLRTFADRPLAAPTGLGFLAEAEPD
jgi:NADPH-dependent 2,4-dienoyl-CoA reductase/sulfur reductase-like enzyme